MLKPVVVTNRNDLEGGVESGWIGAARFGACQVERDQTPSMLRRYSVFAIAAAVLLGIACFAVYDKRKTATEELDSLRGQLAQIEKMADKVEGKQRIVSAISAWQVDDVNWLDELRDLSLRFPGPADAVIERMTISPAAGGGNLVSLQVRVRDPVVVSMMEANLRDEHHSIRSKRVSELTNEEDFGWQFDASILVSPRPPDAYRGISSHLKKNQATDTHFRITRTWSCIWTAQTNVATPNLRPPDRSVWRPCRHGRCSMSVTSDTADSTRNRSAPRKINPRVCVSSFRTKRLAIAKAKQAVQLLDDSGKTRAAATTSSWRDPATRHGFSKSSSSAN